LFSGDNRDINLIVRTGYRKPDLTMRMVALEVLTSLSQLSRRNERTVTTSNNPMVPHLNEINSRGYARSFYQDLFVLTVLLQGLHKNTMAAFNALLTSVLLAVLCSTYSDASPWPVASTYSTRGVKNVGRGLEVETFHPPTDYKVRRARLGLYN
jgi:hypothetical protein